MEETSQLSFLVEITDNTEEVIKILTDMGALSSEDLAKIASKETIFDKKCELYSLKLSSEILIQALRATGNDEAAEKLENKWTPPEPSTANDIPSGEPYEYQSAETGPDHQDSGFIPSEVEQDLDNIIHDAEASIEGQEDEAPEDEPTPIVEQVVPKVFVSEAHPKLSEASDNEEEAGNDVFDSVEEVKPAAVEIAEEKPEELDNKLNEIRGGSPKDWFEERKEATPSGGRGEIKSDGGSGSTSPFKSIVEENRRKFEQSAPKGVNVKYSYKEGNPKAETKESTVKNLKNFFQRLASVDNGKGSGEADVAKRGGSKLGGTHPNRRTMAS